MALVEHWPRASVKIYLVSKQKGEAVMHHCGTQEVVGLVTGWATVAGAVTLDEREDECAGRSGSGA